MKEHPDMGLTLNGTKTALRRVKKRGDIGRKKGSGPPTKKTTAANAGKVSAVFGDDPSASIRGLAKKTNLERTTVATILKKKLMGKFLKKVTARKLANNHNERRLAAYRGFLGEMGSGTLGRRKIFRTDENLFRVGIESGQSSQNFRVWVDKDTKNATWRPAT